MFLGRLPYSIRILLESAVRNCDNFQVKQKDVSNILNWEENQKVEGGIEVAFKPARVILQVSGLANLDVITMRAFVIIVFLVLHYLQYCSSGFCC